MDKKLAVQKIAYWQEALLLQRWKLYYFSTKGNGASVIVNAEYQSASIKLGMNIAEKDLDEFVCHELLHLLLAEKLKAETLIEVLTRAFLRMK